ncbi:hypothetical protein H0X10_04435 [Candidatus Saccharibacteria bacterium]|nr:hypothetical protein [Candidatus Saccharibacteria bacterium]
MAKKKKTKKRLHHRLAVKFPRASALPKIAYYRLKLWFDTSWLHKIVAVFFLLIILWSGTMYGVAQWYMWDRRDMPLKYGVTFIPRYARHFGLEPKDTMQAIIDELGVRQFRLVSYWNEFEKIPGTYDFTELDWQFKMAEQSGSKVSLAIGLRQPRWPECHMPDWAEKMPMSQWSVELKEYMGVVIDRYKSSPALESYQLENEFFLKVFGICPDHSRSRLVDEYNFVKQRDSSHPIIVSRSNNALGWPVNEPIADTTAVSVYKRVWDKSLTKRYFEYPFPAWFYAFLGGAGKLTNGTDLIVHELQAESWLPAGFEMNRIEDIPEQNKSLNAERLKDRIEYGRATGLKEVYLWGVEWWYWRKIKADDPSLWNVARDEISRAYFVNGESPYND